jgi:hypothetical protein
MRVRPADASRTVSSSDPSGNSGSSAYKSHE